MFKFSWDTALQIMFLVVVLGAIARKSSDVDKAITSLAPNIYGFTSLLQGGSGGQVF